MAFYAGERVPPPYDGSILVARHGSHPPIRVGYDVVRVVMRDNRAESMEPFLTGFLQGRKFRGRPVDVLVLADASVLVANDLNGASRQCAAGFLAAGAPASLSGALATLSSRVGRQPLAPPSLESTMKRSTDLARRHLLARGAGTFAAVGLAGLGCAELQPAAPAASTPPAAPKPPAAPAAFTPAAVPPSKPLPAYVSWKDANAMIVHTSTTIETKRSAFGSSVITAAEILYIRNNLPAPAEDIVANRDAWQVAVAGVRNPRTVTVAELKTMGLETLAMVLQCSGNGRGYFPDKPSGTPWTVGAAGCVIWSGVPVRAVAEALGGVASGMKFMTSTGGEKLPDGIDPKTVIVERSVPIAAMADALLAWEMNGAPVPLAHGGPLRVIVPGYTGVNSVKYVKQFAFTAVETDARIQRTGYRLTPPGQKGDPSQPSVWEMAPKSWINSPAPEGGAVKAGLVQIKGVAFGGINAVRRVEVSIEGGRNWREARFVGPDLGRYAWRQFVLPVKLDAGTHVLASRAVDVRGNVQVESRLDNTAGYINSSWRDHALQIAVA